MTATDLLVPAFLVVAVVVLVVLWRRGSEKRGAFFGGGLVIIGIALLLSLTIEGLERAIDDGLQGWPTPEGAVVPTSTEGPPMSVLTADQLRELSTDRPPVRRTPGPTPTVHPAAGSFPEGWRIDGADHRQHAWLFPRSDGLPWTPLVVAEAAFDTCAVVDITPYAERLGLTGVDELLGWELDGFEPNSFRGDRRLVNALTSVDPGFVTGGTVPIRYGDLAYVDVSDARRSQRTYLHHDRGRWTALACRSKQPPGDSWGSLALAFFGEPIASVLEALPTPRPTPRATPSPHLARLRALVPLRACDSQPSETESGALAVLACTAAGDVEVTYALFANRGDLTTWYRRHIGTVRTGEDDAFERCVAGEAVESDWVLEDSDSVKGRFVCRPGTPASDPTMVWTDESSLLGGRATSDEVGLTKLFDDWLDGEYDPDYAVGAEPTPLRSPVPVDGDRDQLVGRPSPSPSPAGDPERRLRDLVPMSDCLGSPDEASRATAEASLTCLTDDGIEVVYLLFDGPTALAAWWSEATLWVTVVYAINGEERCAAGEVVAWPWYLRVEGRPAGSVACGSAGGSGVLAWTDDSLLIGARATSVDHDTPQLYDRWQQGEFEPDRYGLG